MRQRLVGVRPDDGGFTLVELLVAIVILSVLAGIVVFGVARFRDDSSSAACAADDRVVVAAANAFALQQGRYPASLVELEAGGYVKDLSGDVSYEFHVDTQSVSQGTCSL